MASDLPDKEEGEEEVEYAGAPDKSDDLLALEGTVKECIERIDADVFLRRLRSEKDVPKIEVPIVLGGKSGMPAFSAFVQNIVVTHSVDFEGEAEEGQEQCSGGGGFEEMEGGQENVHKLNLPYLARSWRYLGAQYNPPRFDSVIRRDKNYDAAALYFNSGKLVGTGCSRPELALDQLRHEQKSLREILPWRLSLRSPKLQNVVSSGEFAHKLCINYMAVVFSDTCAKVGRFPGTMIKNAARFGDRAILIFPTGRFCHSGGRDLRQIYEDMKKVYPILLRCRSTPELDAIEERCRQRLCKTTSPEQYARETASLRRYINNSSSSNNKRKRKRERNAPAAAAGRKKSKK